MPVVSIAGNENLSNDKKIKMVKKVSEIVSEAYDLPIETITVLIQPYSQENIGVAGKLLSNKK